MALPAGQIGASAGANPQESSGHRSRRRSAQVSSPRECDDHASGIQKTLEDVSIKVTRVISDLLGTSGRAVLRAWIAGETDPERLLAHTTGRLRAPRTRLLAGLRGNVTDYHRCLLRVHLHEVESLEGLLAEFDGRITEMLRLLRDAVERLTTVPGISTTVASVLVAEIGVDMQRFPPSASWSRGLASAPGWTKALASVVRPVSVAGRRG